MIRKSTINLNYATTQKKLQLDLIFNEFKKIVNIYIEKYWQSKKLLKFVSSKVDTWLSARMQQLAGKTAIQIIKSVRKKDRNIRYKKYKKVYSFFKKQNRQLKFLNLRFSELNLNWKIKSIYKDDIIDLDERFVEIQKGKNSFDIWIKFNSIGNKIKLMLPSKKHKHLLKFNNWNQKKSIRLRKNSRGYFCDLIFEKETPEIKKQGESLAIDVGINKLLATSNGQLLGLEIKQLINKLHHRKQKSKNWFQTINEMKNYIRKQCNKIDLENVNLLVLENLTGLTNKKNDKNNKTTRKLLGYWNRELLKRKLEMLCEENRVYLHFVDPAYTSQTCRSCGHISERNRQGEIFQCEKCGFTGDADVLASLNILDRYRRFIVACT